MPSIPVWPRVNEHQLVVKSRGHSIQIIRCMPGCFDLNLRVREQVADQARHFLP